MQDVIIIGAGIVGASIARELSKYKLDILLLEKENDVGNHATIANSAIVHSGHDPKVGSLKAKLCVRGNQLYDTLEKELEIPLLRTGGLVLAHDHESLEKIYQLYERALKNGVEAKLLSKTEILNLEPNVSNDVVKGLSLPTTKVTYPWEVALAMVENALMNGVTFKKNEGVIAIKHDNNVFTVKTTKNTYKTRYVINAAGAFAGEIASMVEHELPYKIKPRKGEYYVLDRRVKGFINHTLYPVPTSRGKGVLLVPQVHGNILVGPSSEYIDNPEDLANTKDGLHYVKEEAKKLAKNIPFNQIIRTFTGIRASSDYEDFYIKESESIKGFIHVAGIDSPGLTAAPAIAEYVIEAIIKKNESLEPNKTFNPYRPHIKMFHEMTKEEKQKAFLDNPRHGRLICKCEKITEGDIVNHIHRLVLGDTVKGIKKRARAGSGICQGGYCEHQVLKLIACELDQSLIEVDYYHEDTPILLCETKVKHHV